jgi:hypothetical protein
MGCVTPVYRPRDAEHTVLHQVVAEHLEAFLDAVAESGGGAGLPQFVEREFREFLMCGVFEHGVARFRCEGCGREHLLPFDTLGKRALAMTHLRTARKLYGRPAGADYVTGMGPTDGAAAARGRSCCLV